MAIGTGKNPAADGEHGRACPARFAPLARPARTDVLLRVPPLSSPTACPRGKATRKYDDKRHGPRYDIIDPRPHVRSLAGCPDPPPTIRNLHLILQKGLFVIREISVPERTLLSFTPPTPTTFRPTLFPGAAASRRRAALFLPADLRFVPSSFLRCRWLLFLCPPPFISSPRLRLLVAAWQPMNGARPCVTSPTV